MVNRTIVIAVGHGIANYHDPSLLVENGGTLEITRKWVESLMKRINLVKRKGTQAARKVPLDFKEIKLAYLDRISSVVNMHKIPSYLVINWDQTGCKFVPTSNWTMEEKGSKQVAVKSLDDKREMTVLLSCTLSGKLLPPQLLYSGKTQQCHPKVDFPPGWDVWHSVNHWSNEQTMLRYVDTILVPYVTATQQALHLDSTHPALTIFDVFSAHHCTALLEKLSANNILQVFVLASCTGELQPLDLTVNFTFKELMKAKFTKWYAQKITTALDEGKSIDDVEVRLNIAQIKPLHAKWLIDVHSQLENKPELIFKGFTKAGIADVL